MSFLSGAKEIYIEARDELGLRVDGSLRNSVSAIQRIADIAVKKTLGLAGSTAFVLAAASAVLPAGDAHAMGGMGEDSPRVRVAANLGSAEENARIAELILQSISPRAAKGISPTLNVEVNYEEVRVAKNDTPKAHVFNHAPASGEAVSTCHISLRGDRKVFADLLERLDMFPTDKSYREARDVIIMHEIAHCEMAADLVQNFGLKNSVNINDFSVEGASSIGFQMFTEQISAGLAAGPESGFGDHLFLLGFEKQADLKAVLNMAWRNLAGARSTFDREYGLAQFERAVDILLAIRSSDKHSVDLLAQGHFSIYDNAKEIEGLRQRVISVYREGSAQEISDFESNVLSPRVSGRVAMNMTAGAIISDLDRHVEAYSRLVKSCWATTEDGELGVISGGGAPGANPAGSGPVREFDPGAVRAGIVLATARMKSGGKDGFFRSARSEYAASRIVEGYAAVRQAYERLKEDRPGADEVNRPPEHQRR